MRFRGYGRIWLVLLATLGMPGVVLGQRAVTGVVTAATGGAPIDGVGVNLYNSSGIQVATGTTAVGTGAYTTSPTVPAGTYFLKFVSNTSTRNYAAELYNDIPCVGFCTVTVGTPLVIGATDPVINAAMTTGGSISGTVTATGGAPLSGVTVWVYTLTGSSVYSSTTDGAGSYTINRLPAGSYNVITAAGAGRINELYNLPTSIPCVGACAGTGGTPVAVTAGTVTSGVNFELDPDGRISGAVTDASTGSALAGVTVQLHTASGAFVISSITDGGGAYTFFNLPTGTYYLVTRNALGYINELYGDIPCIESSCSSQFTNTVVTSGTPVSVTAPGTTSGIGFALTAGGRIGGTVTNASGGAAVANLTVNVYSQTGTSLTSGLTNADGRYVSDAGLPAGSYLVATSTGQGLVAEVYDNVQCRGSCSTSVITTGSAVAVTGPGTVGGINFALAPGGTVTGTVTDDSTALPVSGISVSLYDSVNAFVLSGTTGSTGVFTIGGLQTGTYYARTSNGVGYLNERYDGTVCQSCNANEGTPIEVAAPASTVVNFGLTAGGRISGRVTDSSTGNGVSATVSFYSSSGASVATATTNGLGQYVSGAGLPAGNYFVVTSNSAGLVDEAFDNISCTGCAATVGTPVAVSLGATATGIDFALAPGGRISGRVTSDGGSLLLSGVTVRVYNTVNQLVTSVTTNAVGQYTTSRGLPTGSYFISTGNTQGFIDERNDGAVCLSCNATENNFSPILVTAGATTSGIDFDLTRGARISGTITGPGGPLQSVAVWVYDGAARFVTSGSTNSAGVYITNVGVPSGTYFARTSNTLGYLDEIHSDAPCLQCSNADVTLGTPILVTAPNTTTGVDFALAAGGRVRGQVTGEASQPLSGITVWIYNSAGTQVGSGTTNVDGQYTSGALSSGTYFARITSTVGFVPQTYSAIDCVGSCSAPSGTPIVVAAGSVTAGIDFRLNRGGRVSGTVRSGATPIAGVSVSIFSAASGLSSLVSATTNEAGVYTTTTGLPPGTYFARASGAQGYVGQIYNGPNPGIPCPVSSSCTPSSGFGFSVTAGTIATGIDFNLSAGGRMAGVVVAEDSGLPLPGVSVSVSDVTGLAFSSATTDSSGAFVTGAGMPAGTYYARTTNSLGYIDERFDNTACGTSCAAGLGTPITVALGATTGGVNFQLARGGRVRGTVRRAADGLPQSGVWVRIYAVGSSGIVTSGTTDASGVYITSGGLPSGAYIAETYNSFGLIDAFSPEFAVTAPNTTPNVDFSLQPGGRIRGRVTDEGTGVPVAGVTVSIYDATGFFAASGGSGVDGYYTTARGLRPGTYYAVSAPGTAANYIGERYDGTPCLGCRPMDGTPITVAAGATTDNIDFSLARGGSLEGRVTNASTGAPIGGVLVTVSNTGGLPVRSARTDDTGRYAALGLATAQYFARTSNSLGFIDEVFDNVVCGYSGVCSVTSSTPITVNAGQATTGIDIGLVPGGLISGVVTVQGSSPAVPIPNANITVFDASGRPAGSGRTDGSGRYTTSVGLPTGTYYATAGAPGFVRERYSEEACFPNCLLTGGSPIPVVLGSTTPNVNFTLASGGRIGGRVTDAQTGSGLSGVAIQVYTAADRKYVVAAGTDGSGQYLTGDGLLPGQYVLRTLNSAGRIDELYDDRPCLPAAQFCSGGTPVTIAGTETAGGRDFSLTRGARISGRVTEAATGVPVPNVAVLLFDADGRQVGGPAPIPTAIRANAVTDSDGRYSIGTGLPDGTYFLSTRNLLDFVDERNDGGVCVHARCDVKLGNPGVVLTGGTSIDSVDFGLARGGRIAGAVSAAGNVPLPGVKVHVFNATGAFLAEVITDAAGGYTMPGGLLPGVYHLRTSNGLGYVDEVYDNIICVGCPVTTGTPVSVFAATTTTSIDFVLAQGALLTGTIFDDTTKQPRPFHPVSILQQSPPNPVRIVATTVTDENGVYAVSLPPGRYFVQADGQDGYVVTIYGGAGGGRPRRRYFRNADGLLEEFCPAGLCNPAFGEEIIMVGGEIRNQVNIGVGTCGSMNLTPTGLPLGSLGVLYPTTRFQLTGGATDPREDGFYVTSGQLPPGLRLDVGTGELSGTPSAAGVSTFEVTGVDRVGCAATQQFTVTFCGFMAPAGVTVGTSAGNDTFPVNLAAAGCIPPGFTVSSSATWLTATGTSSSAESGTVSYSWPDRGTFSAARSATVAVGGVGLFTVTQTGVPGVVTAVPLGGGVIGPGAYSTETIAITTNTLDAPWTATADQPWLSVSPSSGSGPGSVTVSVLRNATQAARTGTVTVAGTAIPITQRANGVPGAPTNVGATVANGAANFQWLPPQTGGDATSYDLVAGTGPGLSNIATMPVATNTFRVSSIPAGTYYVRVRSKNEFGTSADSNEYVLTMDGTGTAAPGPPGNLVVTMAGSQLTMTWQSPGLGSPATGYIVEAGSASGLANVASVPVSGTSFTYAPVPNGFYYLRVRGRNSAGVGPPTSEYLLNVGNVPTPPGVPQNFAYSVTGSTVRFTWAAPATGSPASSYLLEAGSAPGLSNLAVAPVGNVLTVSFANVPRGTYYVRLKAANAQGSSPATADMTVTVP